MTSQELAKVRPGDLLVVTNIGRGTVTTLLGYVFQVVEVQEERCYFHVDKDLLDRRQRHGCEKSPPEGFLWWFPAAQLSRVTGFNQFEAAMRWLKSR